MDWKGPDLEEDWRNAILKKAAGRPRAKQIADRLPAYLSPGPRKKYSTREKKRRKGKRRMAQASRRHNR